MIENECTQNILVIAPHADDEVLGVGGTMALYAKLGFKVYVCIVTKGSEPLYRENRLHIIREETRQAHELLGVQETFFLDFPAVMLETIPRYEMNAKLQNIVDKVMPVKVFIPHHGDMQKDHQMVAEACMVVLRPKFAHKVKEIYAYETLSETEWNTPHASTAFIPNVWNDISESLAIKIAAMEKFKTQLADFPNPRSVLAIESLARLRGSNICVNAAEAFTLIRLIN